MAYTPPTLEELLKLCEYVEKNYHKANPERLKYLAFCKQVLKDPKLIKSPNAVKILMGAYLFLVEAIYQSYGVLNPEGGWFNSGSSVYRMLKAGLNVSDKNPLTPQDIFIYMTEFYDYLKFDAPDDIVTGSPWGSREELVGKYEHTMVDVHSRQTQLVDAVIKMRPNPSQLIVNIDNFEKRYIANAEKKAQEKGKAVCLDNLKYAKFVDLMVLYSVTHLMTQDLKNPKKNSNSDGILEAGHQLRLSTLFYMGKVLEEKCGWFVGTGVMYDMCMGKEGINYAKTTEATPIERQGYYSTLHNQIKGMFDYHPEFIEQIQNDESRDFKDIKIFLKQVQEKSAGYLNAAHKDENNYSTTSSTVATGCKGAIGYATNATLFGIGRCIVPASIGATIDVAVGVVCGTVFAILPGCGFVIGAAACHIIRSNLLPALFAGVFAGGVDMFSSAASNAVSYCVTRPVEWTAQLYHLAADAKKLEDADKEALREKKELLEALMKSPDKIFSQEYKSIVEKTLGVQRPSRLLKVV